MLTVICSIRRPNQNSVFVLESEDGHVGDVAAFHGLSRGSDVLCPGCDCEGRQCIPALLCLGHSWCHGSSHSSPIFDIPRCSRIVHIFHKCPYHRRPEHRPNKPESSCSLKTQPRMPVFIGMFSFWVGLPGLHFLGTLQAEIEGQLACSFVKIAFTFETFGGELRSLDPSNDRSGHCPMVDASTLGSSNAGLSVFPQYSRHKLRCRIKILHLVSVGQKVKNKKAKC